MHSTENGMNAMEYQAGRLVADRWTGWFVKKRHNDVAKTTAVTGISITEAVLHVHRSIMQLLR